MGEAVRRLGFRLHDFTRMAWASAAAQELWAPRLDRIARWRAELAWRTVAEGLRPAALVGVAPEALDDLADRLGAQGLEARVVGRLRASASGYAAMHEPAAEDEPHTAWVAVGRTDDVRALDAAWRGSDARAIGALLGYPDCCVAFFEQVWVAQGLVDTTWPMAMADGQDPDGVCRVHGPVSNNILLRWIDVRAVFHLPCSFTCAATAALAERILAVGTGFGEEEAGWLEALLDAPASWSALHGIAEIKTPLLRITTTTDATAGRHDVHWLGTRRLPAAARGLGFPYAGAPSAAPSPVPADLHTDNGFANADAMGRAHAPIVRLARAALAGGGGVVLDLGCGNGELVARIAAACPGGVAAGIDLDPGKVDRARARHPSGRWYADDLVTCEAAWSPAPALTLLMPGRLLEVDVASTGDLRRRIRDSGGRLLVYAYGDQLARYGGLAGLCLAAGVELVATTACGTAGLAAIH